MIGAGDVTEVKSGPGFQKARNSALVAVMRRNGVLARDYAKRHGVPRWYDDANALIHDPEVDVVYIATPPNAHLEYTLICANAGKPVYVEKPMAMNFAECQTMIEACEAAKVGLWPAYYRRTLPRFIRIKEIIDSGLMGEIRSVSTVLFQPTHADEYLEGKLPWRVIPEIAGGGLFVDLGSHTLNFLDYVLGPVKTVAGFAANRSNVYLTEDQVVGSFEFESGVLGIGAWCFTTSFELDRTEIIGTAGKLAFSTFGNQPITLISARGEQTFTIDHPPHVHQPLIQTIVDELNDEGCCPSSAIGGARTAWIVDGLLKGYRQK